MKEKLGRRYRRVAFPIARDIDKYELMLMLKKLPEDARLVRFATSIARGEEYMIFFSWTWDVVPEGQEIPALEVRLSTEEIKDLRRILAMKIEHVHTDMIRVPVMAPMDSAWKRTGDRVEVTICQCDLAYTGAKTHNKSCPLAMSNKRS